ncbi:MAG: hypothetical protein UR34_C0001G0095 [candidate division WS6 bacterium GW2011_GWC1_33_20]|uniref:Uncharacterized protein n=1 Tax=candidate division WS6 bacterium GW2011_GWC1_33_20 TaxID=1619089 RepID=A0A0F9ZL01_9BACT|nr:MAG: hypothetical protein UR36_C0023G0003 [candidate division WS6 bacterium GW2011_GWF1_33_233]KKP44749.1 MAG: hypothetical protein UR34_C0001G0095 [candidate division WS6 bacterium GW2011_GWC1_33_20]KKP52862.1 MAG: hypothetical protein UR45_C0034G0003 [candidate division WS6 bacterium GW2011_WS6_33_547]KKP55648.1 MAG: hypothetical protein UR49_C0036G0003 [candidate division WS6 bacterium GW2011_GWF2_33_92]
MKNKLIVLGTLAVALLGVIAFTTKEADAYRGDYTQVGPNHTEEREAQMEEIFESKDYDAWVALMTEGGRNPGVLDKIDFQEDFNSFVEAHELALEGKTEEANAIREDLGLGQGQRMGNGHGMRYGSGSR